MNSMKMPKGTVVVGMSGGVDSSVTALLLKQQGYEVIGLFMRNWDDDDADCPAAEDYDDVVAVCKQIGIPHYVVNFSKEYWDRVFAGFLQDLKSGLTPNPDVLCNREIKFACLLEKALAIGGDYLATGHYCRNVDGQLLRGLDTGKDQSYFLYTITSDKLKHVLFPVGELHKKDVRALAIEHDLVTSRKKDSTGICFIGKRNFKEFVSKYLAYQKGEFRTFEGKVVGEHSGVAYYTIGQRKGLGIGGPGEAWFVAGKDVEKNIVYVVQGDSHPALYREKLVARDLSWVNGLPQKLPFRCEAQIRYRQPAVHCLVEAYEENAVHVVFDAPQKAVTPHQSIVFYEGDVCLGGGFIDCPLMP